MVRVLVSTALLALVLLALPLLYQTSAPAAVECRSGYFGTAGRECEPNGEGAPIAVECRSGYAVADRCGSAPIAIGTMGSFRNGGGEPVAEGGAIVECRSGYFPATRSGECEPAPVADIGTSGSSGGGEPVAVGTMGWAHQPD